MPTASLAFAAASKTGEWMSRDFNDKHQITAWPEELHGGIVRLFSFDFADLVLTRLDISPAHSLAAGVQLDVMRCSPRSTEWRASCRITLSLGLRPSWR